MKILFSVFAFLLLAGTAAHAQEVSALVGAQGDNADTDTAGGSVSGKIGFHAGAVVFFPVKDALEIRSGFIYTSRSFGYSLYGTSTSDYNFSYVQVPVDLFYKFSEFGGAFVGPSLDFNVSSSCPGSCKNVNALPLGVEFGVNFHFAPQLSAELYYEFIPGKLEDNIKNEKAIALSLLVNFE